MGTGSPPANAGRGEWTTNGPAGADVEQIAIDPTDPSTIYLATWGSGVFRSTNAGTTWRPVNEGLADAEVSTIAIDPLDPDTVFAGTEQEEIYRSTNGGRRWQLVFDGSFCCLGIAELAIDPSNPDRIAAATGGDLTRVSADGGDTWVRINRGLPHDQSSVEIGPDPLSTIYIGSEHDGVFRSERTPNGIWFVEGTGFPDDTWVMDITIDPTDASVLYAATESGVYTSTDGAASWTAASQGLTDLDVLAVQTDPLISNRVYAGTATGGMFVSDDGAASWHPAGVPEQTIQAVSAHPRRAGTIYVGTTRGVYKTTDDGASWTSINAGLTGVDVEDVAVARSDPDRVYSAGAGLFRSTDGGNNWSHAETGLPVSAPVAAVAVDPGDEDLVYAGIPTHGFFISADGGSSWAPSNDGLADLDVRDVAIDPGDPSRILLAMCDGGVSTSMDGGATWERTSEGLDSACALVLAFSPTDPAVVYLGSGDGGADTSNVHRSTDSGRSWVPIGDSIVNGSGVHSVVVDPLDPNIVYVGTSSSGVLKSIEGGLTWIQLGLASQAVLGLAVDPTDPLTVYAGQIQNGVRVSHDGGVDWSPINEGLTTKDVMELAIDPMTGDRLFASTQGGGVFDYQPL